VTALTRRQPPRRMEPVCSASGRRLGDLDHLGRRRSHRVASRRAEAPGNRRGDAFRVEPAASEQKRRVAMIDELVRQPEMQHGHRESLACEDFRDRTAGPSGDDVFLDGHQRFVSASQIRDELGVERLDEAHVGHRCVDFLGRCERWMQHTAEREDGDAVRTPARFAALSAGAVDASVMWFPVTEIAKAQGYRKLFDLKEIFPEWPYETFAARESWLAKERADVVKFLRAYQRGVKNTLDNKNDAVKIMLKYVKLDPAYAPAGYDHYRSTFPVNGVIAEKAIPTVIDQEFENGRLGRRITREEMIDHTFITMLGGK